jgi:hypothetical protein
MIYNAIGRIEDLLGSSGMIIYKLDQILGAVGISPMRPRSFSQEDEDPRPYNISPVTQGERIAYSMSEYREYLEIVLRAEKGTEANVVRKPSSPNISLTYSGSVA